MIMMLMMYMDAAVVHGPATFTCSEEQIADQKPGVFYIRFHDKKGKLSKIAVEDAQDVLDPLGKLPVYSASGSGPLVITKSTPPKRKPMLLSGKVEKSGSYFFTSKDPALSLSIEKAADGTYAYNYTGNRLLSGTMRMGYDGNGTCTFTPASGDGKK
jgi:hypothetical protein